VCSRYRYILFPLGGIPACKWAHKHGCYTLIITAWLVYHLLLLLLLPTLPCQLLQFTGTHKAICWRSW
jgi:hypothetical protein